MIDAAELIKGIPGCGCGRPHSCPIERIAIGKDALELLPELLAGYGRVLLVADRNTWRVCGERAYGMIPCAKEALVLSDNGKLVIPDEEKIAEISERVSGDTEVIVGVGSGVINDLCKIVSFRRDLPYFIVATAPSMDGYASSGSALILDGMKVTLNARPPKAIIADTRVLSEAPLDMIQAGYGDIMGKYSALNDWKLSALINGEYLCQRIWDLTYATAEELRPLAGRLLKRDAEAVGKLMEALVIVGIMMSFAGCSRPASGSEHHLSHFFEVTGILNGEPYFSHGIDVLYSSVKTAQLREEIVRLTPRKREISRTLLLSEMKRIYKDTAPGMIALQDGIGRYVTDDSEAVYGKWDGIVEILKEAPSVEETLRMVSGIGLDYSDFLKTYGPAKIRDAVNYAKDIKDRYTVLWLYFKYFRHIVSGHRGNVDGSGRMRENTLSAIRRAARKGAEMFETDARLTRDGVLVSNHDPSVTGVDADGKPLTMTIADVTFEELSRLILAPDDPEGPQGVPLLEDVLKICRETGIRPNFDLKNGIANARQVAELAVAYGQAGRAVYGLNGSGTECINLLLGIDPDALFIDKPSNFTREKLRDVKDYGKHCFAYTYDFSDENIAFIRGNGCMLASTELTPETRERGLRFNPEMTEYRHTSDFEVYEE